MRPSHCAKLILRCLWLTLAINPITILSKVSNRYVAAFGGISENPSFIEMDGVHWVCIDCATCKADKKYHYWEGTVYIYNVWHKKILLYEAHKSTEFAHMANALMGTSN
jgi:hypothetical protein